jgi:hypothetical protein
VDFDPQLQSCTADLILQSQPHELRFILAQCHREPRGSLQADGSPSVLDVTQLRPRDTKSLRELGEALPLAFAQGG